MECSFVPQRVPGQPHHGVVLMVHNVIVHRQDPVSFPETMALGRGAWIHPVHHMVSLAQLVLQMEPKILLLLSAQQTEARPLQVPGIWRRRWVGSQKGGRAQFKYRTIK